MTSNTNEPYRESSDVQWDDPRIRDLMRRAERLSIDQRGGKAPKPVLIRPSWNHATASLPGLLMDDDGAGQMTIVTSMAFASDDAVIIEKPRIPPYPAELVLGTVLDCRAGHRAEDRGKIFVSHFTYKPHAPDDSPY